MVEETKEVKEEVKPAVAPAAIEKEQEKLDKEQVPDPEDKITRATAVAKRIEDANTKYEELLAREERLKTVEILGGDSEVIPKKTQEEKDKEGAKALLPEGMDCPGVTD